MKLFAYCWIAYTSLLLTGCAERKQENTEVNDPEIEADVMVGKERSEIRMSIGNIYQTVGDNESLKILRDALRTTGLDAQLAQEGPYTLFAPSDKAFEEMRQLTLKKLPADMEKEKLKELLLHHVAKGNYSAADLVNMQGVVTLGGDSVHIINIDNQLTIDSALVIFPDRHADNGYVHVIDEVLMPESSSN